MTTSQGRMKLQEQRKRRICLAFSSPPFSIMLPSIAIIIISITILEHTRHNISKYTSSSSSFSYSPARDSQQLPLIQFSSVLLSYHYPHTSSHDSLLKAQVMRWSEWALGRHFTLCSLGKEMEIVDNKKLN